MLSRGHRPLLNELVYFLFAQASITYACFALIAGGSPAFRLWHLLPAGRRRSDFGTYCRRVAGVPLKRTIETRPHSRASIVFGFILRLVYSNDYDFGHRQNK
jgi:hypothetical protein